MLKHQMRNAMNRWKDTGCGFTMEMSSTMIVEEERGIAQEAHNISKINKERKIHADKCARQVKVLEEEKVKLVSHKTKAVANMMDKNLNCFFTPKLNHIFHTWRDYTSKKKRSCQQLSNCMYKTACKRTFDRILAVSRAQHTSAQ